MKGNGSVHASARELKICPSLSNEQYLLVINQYSNSLVRGCASSLFLDRGENFVHSREYQQGDQTSSIDWKASARSRQLIVKEHESLRKTVVSLVVDRSGSMTAGSASESKYAVACFLCGGLAFAALKIGSPVATILSDGEVHPHASLSSDTVSTSLVSMRSFRYRELTPLSRCLEDGFRRAYRRQLVFVLSDFHDPCAPAKIAALAKNHEVVLVRLRDTMEMRTPRWGTIRLHPAEGSQAHYARHQRPRCGAVDEAIASLGLPTVSIDPEQPLSEQLRNFLALRRSLS